MGESDCLILSNVRDSNQAIRQSGNQAIRQSGNQAIRQSGNQAIRQSGNQFKSMEIERLIDEAANILRRRGKISYAALKVGLSIDDSTMEIIRDELVDVLEIAVDKNGKVLVLKEEGDAQGSGRPDSETNQTTKMQNNVSDEGERRVLAVLFCDLVGSTQLSSKLDTEDLREVFKAYQRVVVEAIDEFEGYVAQFLGDGVLAYFGYPQIHESDALRAVKASLLTIEKLGKLNANLAKSYGIELAVRIGIHTGEVVIGNVGSEARTETLALGHVPNVAARLQSKAGEDQVIVSAETSALLKNRVSFECLGDFELSGVDGKQTLYRVVGLSDEVSLDPEGE